MSDSNTPRLIAFLLTFAGLGREDYHAQRSEHKDGRAGYYKNGIPLTEGHLADHLTGQRPIGIYLLKGSQTQIAVLDLDDHNRTCGFENIKAAASKVIDRLRLGGLKPFIVRSGGGEGIHIWIIFERPQQAFNVREQLREILAECGFRPGTGGVAKNQIELFPKQDSVDDGGFGSLIALPFARQSVPLVQADLNPISLTAYEPPSIKELYSPDLPELEKRTVAARTIAKLSGDESEVQLALRHISAADRDMWIRIGTIIKHEFADSGFLLWHEWSKSAPGKYQSEDDCQRTWDGLRPSGKVNIGTLFYLVVSV